MKECILKLIEIKKWLIEQIQGNYANQVQQIKIYQPFIDKIDSMIMELSKITPSKEDK